MSETWIPKNKKELLNGIDHEWSALMRVANQLSSEQMITPDSGGWSPKDNLAHLAEWMNILMGYHMDRRPAPEVLKMPEDATKGWDMEIINPLLFERNRNRSTQDVLDGLKRVYLELIQKLEAMSFDDLLKPRHENDPEKRPVLLWVLGNTTEHFAEHRETIERTLTAKSS